MAQILHSHLNIQITNEHKDIHSVTVRALKTTWGSSLYYFRIKCGCFCVNSEAKADKDTNKTVLARQFFWFTTPNPPPPTKQKGQKIAITHIWLLHKKYQHYAWDSKNLLVKMKRTEWKGDRYETQQSGTDSTLNTRI